MPKYFVNIKFMYLLLTFLYLNCVYVCGFTTSESYDNVSDNGKQNKINPYPSTRNNIYNKNLLLNNTSYTVENSSYKENLFFEKHHIHETRDTYQQYRYNNENNSYDDADVMKNVHDIDQTTVDTLTTQDMSTIDVNVHGGIDSSDSILGKYSVYNAKLSQSSFVYTQPELFSITFEFNLKVPSSIIFSLNIDFPSIFQTDAMKCRIMLFYETPAPIQTSSMKYKRPDGVEVSRFMIRNISSPILEIECSGIKFPPHSFGESTSVTDRGWIFKPIQIPIKLFRSPQPTDDEPADAEYREVQFSLLPLSPLNAGQSAFSNAQNCIASLSTELKDAPTFSLAITGQNMTVSPGDIIELVLNNTIAYFTPPLPAENNGVNLPVFNTRNGIDDVSHGKHDDNLDFDDDTDDDIDDTDDDFEDWTQKQKNKMQNHHQNHHQNQNQNSELSYQSHSTLLNDHTTHTHTTHTTHSDDAPVEPIDTDPRLECQVRYFTYEFSSDMKMYRVENHTKYKGKQIAIYPSRSIIQLRVKNHMIFSEGMYISCVHVFPQQIVTTSNPLINGLAIYEPTGSYRKLYFAYEAETCGYPFGILAFTPIMDLLETHILLDDKSYRKFPKGADYLQLLQDQKNPSDPDRIITHTYRLSSMLTRPIQHSDTLSFYLDKSIFSSSHLTRFQVGDRPVSLIYYIKYPYFPYDPSRNRASFILYIRKDINFPQPLTPLEMDITYSSTYGGLLTNPVEKITLQFSVSITNPATAKSVTVLSSIPFLPPSTVLGIIQSEYALRLGVTDLIILPMRMYNQSERMQFALYIQDIIRSFADNENATCVYSSIEYQNTEIEDEFRVGSGGESGGDKIIATTPRSYPNRSKVFVDLVCFNVHRAHFANLAVLQQLPYISGYFYHTRKVLVSASSTYFTSKPECMSLTEVTPLTRKDDQDKKKKYYKFTTCGSMLDGLCFAHQCGTQSQCIDDEDCLSKYCVPEENLKNFHHQDNQKDNFTTNSTTTTTFFQTTFATARSRYDLSQHPPKPNTCYDLDHYHDGDEEKSPDNDPKPKTDNILKVLIVLLVTTCVFFLIAALTYSCIVYFDKRRKRIEQEKILHYRILEEEIEYDQLNLNQDDNVNYYDVYQNGT